jgi:hypothetical protein
MAKKKKNGITIKKVKRNGVEMLIVPKNATARQICRAYKEQFTAADLVECLEALEGPMVPAEQLLAELEAIHREETEKQQKRRRKT